MAHYHLGLASSYADYFAAAGGGDDDAAVATVVVPEEAVDARVDGDRHIIYGHHHQQQRADEALFVPVVETMGAHSSEHAHHRQQQLGRNHSTTTLKLREPADASSPSSSSLMVHQQQRQLGGGARHRNHHWRQAWPQEQQQGPRGSRFLLPTQQLLHEFCSLPVERDAAASSKAPPANVDDATSAAPSARIQAMDAAELQRLKAKLYTMIDEVDRRYRRYREQMWAVAGSFQAIAGAQAAAAYTRLASRTISRHFRTLRDGVAAQVEAVRRALGEKDTGAAGVPNMRETTPRLRALDQCLRQNRAYYLAGGVLDSQPWRPQRGLPERAVSILRAWLFEHFLHPYPSDVDKRILAHQTGLSRSQVSNWFINARVRLWKPMVEEMYAVEEVTTTTKDDLLAVEAGCSTGTNVVVSSSYPNRPACYTSAEGRRWARGEAKEGVDEDDDDGGSGGEMKPTPAQLMVVHDHDDAGSLASVVSIGSRDRQRNLNFGVTTTMDHLGFGAYDDVADEGQGFVGGGGLSLTLGLQHVVADPNRRVNVAFAAPAPTAAAAHSEFMFVAGSGGAEQQHMGVAGGVYSSSHHFGASVDDGDTGMRIMTAAKTNTHHQGASATTGFQLLHDLAG